MWASRLGYAGAFLMVVALSFVGTLYLLMRYDNERVASSQQLSAQTEIIEQGSTVFSFQPGNTEVSSILRRGWLNQEQDCRWGARRSDIFVNNSFPPDNSLKLMIVAKGLVALSRKKQNVSIIVNGSFFGTLDFSTDKPSVEKHIKISPAVLKVDKDFIRITFIDQKPASLASIGLGSDKTQRSICLRRIALKEAVGS